MRRVIFLLAAFALITHSQAREVSGVLGPMEVSDGFPGPGEELRVKWVEVSLPDLYRICRGSEEGWQKAALNGCFKKAGDLCVIYTLPLRVWEARNNPEHYHSTAGHELRHCRDGHFHGEPNGVRAPGELPWGKYRLQFRR